MSKNRMQPLPASKNADMQPAMVSTERYPETAPPMPPAFPAAVYASLGTPVKLVSLRPTLIPGRGSTVDTFSTGPRNERSMSDYGGFKLELHELGVLVTDVEKGGRVLVPWGQVQAVELRG